ncbi:diguanylate cyclase (GGDEF)-like protein [Planomicrobium stackebrandtii]|uniref:Diguanylate cyclase (GGDEF)-like protein n=1 Tax=Planomicrobium stackebrandtii TaxID=253160 RepID=A0ABU0GQB2_9BACL|nr:bifunctional diguanylate cyclase/phosphodiesterase [Planomicrobium stackebrandtii]MDQ0427544.1 diguanylate cyclase (GGDEF)-like protein [Planomicrobium stackebrandtii]
MNYKELDHPGLMDSRDEFLIAIDSNGVMLHVNEAWINFCMTQNEKHLSWLPGGNLFDHLNKRGKDDEIELLQQVLNNQVKEQKIMYPFKMKDGKIQWLQGKVRKLLTSSNLPNSALLSFKLVSLESSQLITAELVLESMTEGFILLDSNMQIVYLNKIAEKYLRNSRENVMLGKQKNWFSDTANASFYSNCKKASTNQMVQEFIDYFEPLDTWFQIKVCPLTNGSLSVYFHDVSDQKIKEVQIAESTYYDYVTGLPNRRSLMLTAGSLISRKKKFSVFHISIDKSNYIHAFDHYNTSEALMKIYADKLKGFSSETCHVGRMEGNEFIVLREPVQKESLTDVAKQMDEVFCQPISLTSSQKMNVSISIGITCFPYDASTMNDLFSCAEIAMHETKISPGSFYSFYRPWMKVSYNRKLIIERDLSRNFKELGYYYTLQPQIDGSSGQVVGAEVLSRWLHPEIGEISPVEFIQIAEASGQINALTLHLLDEVFIQIKDWQKKFDWKQRIAINMTSSLLSDPVFFDNFFELMERRKINPNLLEIEITEQVELIYSPQTLETLLLCKSKGISISVDDFGTGFSMISYLTNFPINKIKIDRSFVKKIGQDRKSEAVLKSLIYLAKSIECDLIAEGVERIEEVEFLRENGCDVFQGYLYDKPMKPTDFESKYLQFDSKNSVNTKRLKSLPYS